MHQRRHLLLVDILQNAVMKARAQRRGPFVVAPDKIEAIGFEPRGGTTRGQVLVIRGVTLVDLAQLAEVQGQAVELCGVQPGTLERLGQQAGVVEHHQRQKWGQRTDLQHAVRHLEFGGQAQLAVFIFGTPRFTAAWQ
ncbi:hypothetical protein D9M71_654760 [compost metagenome]